MDKVVWLGHSSFRITGEKVIYFDPFRIAAGTPADLILITHDHYDHFDMDAIAKIYQAETIIVAPVRACRRLAGPTNPVSPGDKLTVAGLSIEVVPAYNIDKQFHPQENQNVGYIIHMNDTTYYHAGDTDHIPEMKNIRAEVAFLPVSGTYTMNAAEAAAAVKEIQPKIAVPMHWGTVCGSRADAEKFQKLADCKVIILNRGK